MVTFGIFWQILQKSWNWELLSFWVVLAFSEHLGWYGLKSSCSGSHMCVYLGVHTLGMKIAINCNWRTLRTLCDHLLMCAPIGVPRMTHAGNNEFIHYLMMQLQDGLLMVKKMKNMNSWLLSGVWMVSKEISRPGFDASCLSCGCRCACSWLEPFLQLEMEWFHNILILRILFNHSICSLMIVFILHTIIRSQ